MHQVCLATPQTLKILGTLLWGFPLRTGMGTLNKRNC